MVTKALAHKLTDLNRDTTPTSMPDLYWLAGILEGEGTFCGGGGKNRYFPRISMATADLDVAIRVCNLLDTNLYLRKPDAPHHKQVFLVQIAGRRAVGWMMTLYSLMGERRRKRIHGLLVDWRR